MDQGMVIIVKKSGEQYETPIENLENIRRLVEYTDIIYPGFEEEKEESEDEVKPMVTKPKGRPKANKVETN